MRLPSPEQIDFARTIDALLEKRDPLAPLRQSTDHRTLDEGLWSALTDTGLLDPVAEGDVVTACLVAEALGRRAAPLPYLSAALGTALVTAAGGTVTGLTTVGLWGADSLWSAAPLTVSGGRASGSLPFVPDADVAEVVVVPVEQPDGVRLGVVRTVDAEVTQLTTLDSTQPLCRLTCSDVPLELLPATAAEVRTTVASAEALGVALHSATLLGLMSWLLDTTVEYTGQRVQFGMPIAARQAVKHACATMLIQVESTRSMVLELADLLETEPDAHIRDVAVAATKSWASDSAEQVASAALQLHGGIGFTWEHDLHHYFKRSVVGSTLLGTPSHHRRRLAALLTDTAGTR